MTIPSHEFESYTVRSAVEVPMPDTMMPATMVEEIASKFDITFSLKEFKVS
jgi:hypothetical protein